MWIPVALTPISVGRGVPSIEWAVAGITARAVNAVNIASARNTFPGSPWIVLHRLSRRGLFCGRSELARQRVRR